MKRSQISKEYYFLDCTKHLINDYLCPMFRLVYRFAW